MTLNPLNAELNPNRHLLALVGARHIVHVSRIRVHINLPSVTSLQSDISMHNFQTNFVTSTVDAIRATYLTYYHRPSIIRRSVNGAGLSVANSHTTFIFPLYVITYDTQGSCPHLNNAWKTFVFTACGEPYPFWYSHITSHHITGGNHLPYHTPHRTSIFVSQSVRNSYAWRNDAGCKRLRDEISRVAQQD